MPSQISAEAALEKFAGLRATYSKWHSQIKTNRKFYDRKFAEKVMTKAVRERGFQPVIPRTARRSIDEAADHILYSPKVKVPARPTRSNYTTEQDIAQKKRRALRAWWSQVEDRYNPLGDGRKWLLIDGAIAIRQTINWELVPDKPETSDSKAWARYRRELAALGAYGFLWNVELLNNEWVYVDPSNPRDPKYAYVHYTIRVEEARERFPDATGKWRTRGDYEKVNFLEYWSKPTFLPDGGYEPGKFYQWVDDESVGQEDNPYPYVPIAVEDSGWGLVHASADPHERFVGLNEHSHDVFVAQARQWSAMQAVTEQTAFNPVVTRNLSDEEIAELEVGPGAVWNLKGSDTDPDRQNIEFLTWPAIPLTVIQMIQLTDREVNGSLKLDTLGGIPQSGVDTATEADQNVRNATAKLAGPVAALERLAKKMSRWMLMDVEHVLEAPVTLYTLASNDEADVQLTPRDISGYYEVDVELRTTDEEAMSLTKARFWADMYRLVPTLSAQLVVERGEMSDQPMEEMFRRSAEDVYLSPEFHQLRVGTGAQNLGELAQYLAELQRQTNSGGQENAQPPPFAPTPQTPTDLSTPTTSRIIGDAYEQRDINQAAGAYSA